MTSMERVAEMLDRLQLAGGRDPRLGGYSFVMPREWADSIWSEIEPSAKVDASPPAMPPAADGGDPPRFLLYGLPVLVRPEAAGLYLMRDEDLRRGKSLRPDTDGAGDETK